MGGVKVGIEYFQTTYNKSRYGFSRKYGVFFCKIRNSDFFSNVKKDFKKWIVGGHVEVGLNILLNHDPNIAFCEDNTINKLFLHSLNFFVGIKEEVGGMVDFLSTGGFYPTKILAEIVYLADCKKGFSFYISFSISRCFSPVFLFSFDCGKFYRVFNSRNKYAWNVDISFGVFCVNFFI